MKSEEVKEVFEREEEKEVNLSDTASLAEIAKAIMGGEMSVEAMSAEDIAGLSHLAGLIAEDINAERKDWLGEFDEDGLNTLESMLEKFGGLAAEPGDSFDPSDLPASRTGTYQDTNEGEANDIKFSSVDDILARVAAENAMNMAKEAAEKAASKANAAVNSPIRITTRDENGSIVVIQEGKKDSTQIPADPNEEYAPDFFDFEPPTHDPLILEDQDHVDIELLWEGNPDDEIALYEQDRFEPVVDVATFDDALEHTTQPPVESMTGL